jgi:hypothetical protein
VIGTLWPVGDIQAVKVADAVYRRLADGADIGRRLPVRLSRLRLRSRLSSNNLGRSTYAASIRGFSQSDTM